MLREVGGVVAATPAELFAELGASEALARALAVNVYDDVRWFAAERFELLVEPLSEKLDPDAPERVAATLREIAERSEYRFDRLIGREEAGSAPDADVGSAGAASPRQGSAAGDGTAAPDKDDGGTEG